MSQTSDELRRKAARIVTQKLESLQRAGVSHLPKRGQNKVKDEKELRHEPPHPDPLPGGEGEGRHPHPNPLPKGEGEGRADQRAAALAVIQNEVAACTRCPQLQGRTQTVFGVGNVTPQICFFGEAPGADEDRLGEPFVGRGGQLLNKMIVACGLAREEVYILNVLKCRPPENRNPLPDEVANCRGYFERQLEILRPEIICCLGAVASQALLQTDRSIGKLRGRFHDHQGTAVVCTYHPAYLLRNPSAKVDAWEDLKMMMRRLGVEL
jgi:uracil-DNA glycosylase